MTELDNNILTARRKSIQRVLCLALCWIILLLAALPAQAVVVYTEEKDLGSISAQYESNGKPETISSGSGDAGGKSYGAYQFSSKAGVPKKFADWCASSSDNTVKIYGNILNSCYQADGNTYGANFDEAWKQLGTEHAEVFLKLQHNYVKSIYYDVVVAKLQAQYGLNVSKRSMALKNAVWSRSVQHGTAGCMRLFEAIASRYPNFVYLYDDQIIRLLYEESSAAVSAAPYSNSIPIKAANVSNSTLKKIIADYGLEGKYLKYYSRNSAAVQASVFRRLRVSEYNDLMTMFSNEFRFRDVTYEKWYYSAVEYVAGRGLMNGMSANTFEPETNCDRAMVVTILYRLSGSPSAGNSSFSDVKSSDYFSAAVAWAQNSGVVTGTSPTTFHPKRAVSRQELAAMLFRYAAYRGKNTSGRADLSGFADRGQVADWAMGAMQWCVSTKLIQGDENKLLRPTDLATRAQIATMIQRFVTMYGM